MNDELNKNRMTLIRQIQGEGNDLLYVGPDTYDPRRVEIQLAHSRYMSPNPVIDMPLATARVLGQALIDAADEMEAKKR